MEPVPTSVMPARSLPKWIVFILGLVIGAGAGYGVFSYFAPNADQIAENVRVDIERKNELGERKISGEVTEVNGTTFTLKMSFPGGETRDVSIETNDKTVFQTLAGEVSIAEVKKGAHVAVTVVESGSLVAQEVTILTE